MVAISTAESSCRPDALGDTTLTYQVDGRTYGYSVGAMQVRILQGREACDTYDLATNVDCAHRIWLAQTYKAWSVCLNERYKQFL